MDDREKWQERASDIRHDDDVDEGYVAILRITQTYIQQLCEDTGCGLEDLAEAMDDREKWQERARDIRHDDDVDEGYVAILRIT